jgi:hypothetical protein
MRRHITYANIAATLALVFAMSGGALAAKHYLINSTSQISPKVLRHLKGHDGAPGRAGIQGREGVAGKQGPAGKDGAPGPVSVTRIDFFEPIGGTPNEGGELRFLGQTVTDRFSGPKTAADVTASLDIGSSDGKEVAMNLSICFMLVGGNEVTPVAFVSPEFTVPKENFVTQTVTGVITGLPSGSYVIGACADGESANLLHGDASGSVLLAETAEGGSTGQPALRASARALPQRH